MQGTACVLLVAYQEQRSFPETDGMPRLTCFACRTRRELVAALLRLRRCSLAVLRTWWVDRDKRRSWEGVCPSEGWL